MARAVRLSLEDEAMSREIDALIADAKRKAYNAGLEAAAQELENLGYRALAITIRGMML